MMFSWLTMLIMAACLYSTLNKVNCAGLPSTNNVSVTGANADVSTATFDYKFEALVKVINKMDESIHNLQEKTHTWAIFQHHIESWNDGIRSLENKLDLLKRKHEEQQEQLDKLHASVADVLEKDMSIRQEIRNSLKAERDIQMMSSSKLNAILRHLQTMQLEGATTAGQTQKKNANVMGPVNSSNVLDKIEQRLNLMSYQVAQQKELKQLHSLEKRNSKSLENLNELITHSMDKQEEFDARLQRSNECCLSLSNELTTFTESSDILLKRIEKLVRNVSVKLNQIEAIHKTVDEVEADEQEEVENKTSEEIDNINVSTEKADCTFCENRDDYADVEDNEDDAETYGVTDEFVQTYGGIDPTSDNVFVDGVQDIEFIRPTLKGCHELILNTSAEDHIDGVYKFLTPDINEKERDFNERYCFFPKSNDSNGLPWTVIQHRGPYKQQENFNRSWSDYRHGFGFLYRDFWFGNEYIHRLVYNEDYELRIEMEDFNGTKVWAEYDTFRIDSEQYNYNLLIAGYRGIVADGMKYHNDKDFSTYDRRNDRTVDACCSCAMGYASGWWFDNCAESNLNGIYHDTPLNHNYIGIMWELWHGDYSLKATRMMIRPHNISKNSNPTNSLPVIGSEEHQQEDP